MDIYLTFRVGSMCFSGVCSHVLVLGLTVRLTWYPVWWVVGSGDCDACAVVCMGCEYAETVPAMLVWGRTSFGCSECGK